MRTFTDSTKTEWKIDLPFGEIMRIKEDSHDKFNLLDPLGDKLSHKLDENLIEFWELLWHIVRLQAKDVMPTAAELRSRGNAEAMPGAAGIDAKEFGRRMAGDHLIEAQKVFFEEWRDFFHLIQRPDTAEALEAITMVRKQTVERVRNRLRTEPAFKELPRQTGDKIDSILNEKFSDFQDALASILSTSPGELSGFDTKASLGTPESVPSPPPTSTT